MRTRSALVLVVLIGCGSDSPAPQADAGGELDGSMATDAGPPPRGDRRLGIDVSTASGEEFGDAFAVAESIGINHISFPLDWRSIEAGPNDDFSNSTLNTNKWTRTSPVGTLEHQNLGTAQAPDHRLTWRESGAATDDAILEAAFRLSGEDASAAVDIELVSAIANTESTLLLRTSGDQSGNQCTEADDNFVALVFTTTGAQRNVIQIACVGGALTPAVVTPVAVPAIRARLRRTASGIVSEYDPGTGYVQINTVPGLTDPARPYLYFRNPASGDVAINVDNFAVTGLATWDDPNDRYFADASFPILDIVDLVYGGLPVAVTLSIRTINTVALEMPSDLVNPVAFSSSETISRFNDFVTHVKSKTPNVTWASLSVGNEVNAYLGDNAALWADYIAFVNAVVPSSRTTMGANVPVGVKATWESIKDHQAELVALNASTDAIMLNYYPLQGDFTMRDPAVVHDDFNDIVAALSDPSVADKPIFMTELGYASAPPSEYCVDCDSSEQRQAEFFAEFFAAWDTHRDRIELVTINWLTDVNQSTIDGWCEYYMLCVPTFLEYLRTIGVRNNDGSEKAALQVIRDEAAARGW